MSDQDPQAPGHGYRPPGGREPYPEQQYGQQQYGQGGPYGQGGQYGQQYQQPHQQGEQRRTNTMAILALVFAFVVAPLGAVFGFVARSQIKRTGEAGSGLALAGIVIGLVSVVFYVLLIGLLVAGVASTGGTSDIQAPAPSPVF